jgi:hypothetical protein
LRLLPLRRRLLLRLLLLLLLLLVGLRLWLRRDRLGFRRRSRSDRAATLRIAPSRQNAARMADA